MIVFRFLSRLVFMILIFALGWCLNEYYNQGGDFYKTKSKVQEQFYTLIGKKASNSTPILNSAVFTPQQSSKNNSLLMPDEATIAVSNGDVAASAANNLLAQSENAGTEEGQAYYLHQALKKYSEARNWYRKSAKLKAPDSLLLNKLAKIDALLSYHGVTE